MLEILYPVIAAVAGKLGGFGQAGTKLKRLAKYSSFFLAAAPLIYLFSVTVDEALFNAPLFAVLTTAGIIYRRQVADSRDFPHRIPGILYDYTKPENEQENPAFNFDDIIGRQYMPKDIAERAISTRVTYKQISFALNKMCTAFPLYCGWCILSLSIIPLIGVLLSPAVAIIYRRCYEVVDYDLKLNKISGHSAAEIISYFFYGIIDVLLVFYVAENYSF